MGECGLLSGERAPREEPLSCVRAFARPVSGYEMHYLPPVSSRLLPLTSPLPLVLAPAPARFLTGGSLGNSCHTPSPSAA